MVGTTTEKRPGTAAIMVLVALPILLGMAALAIDVGYIFTSTAELQNAVDAGALAGASALPASDSEVKQRAMESAAQNYVSGESVAVPLENIEVGYWESVSRTFTAASGSVDPSGARPNAVRVVGRRQRLPLIFATVLGRDFTNLEREAIALMDSGRCLGVWGLNGVVGLGDIVTDSYDSRVGVYGPGNINRNGDVCSNKDILLGGSFEINGDAMCGPGHEITVRGERHVVWGVEGELSESLEAPVVSASEVRISNDNDTAGTNRDGLSDNGVLFDGDLGLVEDDNVTLWGGTYYLTSLTMVASSTITVQGSTVLYIDGNVNIAALGIVNVSRQAADLTVYCTGESFVMAGHADFYGMLIAPDTDVELQGDCEFFGMIVADTLDASGSALIHVDEVLAASVVNRGRVPVLVK
ncbi:MAG: hypothetical protein JSV19_04085 [Phycisphaerales bacterium]|nr:MAG: hypothetical protein JSV19_04085 [Phycisphaerales bacterium]